MYEDDSKQLYAFTLDQSNMIQGERKHWNPVEKVTEVLEKKYVDDLLEYRFIAVPVNITKEHWYSFLIDTLTWKFIALDSFHQKYEKHHKKTF